MTQKKIPVLIVTGFLGAGKTTVINHILKNKNTQRVAIIENEFGNISIDTNLLKVAQEKIVEITQWCLCCSVREDFIEILEGFAKKQSEIDLVIIELSGASEIDPVIETFGVESIRAYFKIDSIWGIYDAQNIDHAIVRESELTRRQLEVCDVIIINKMDDKIILNDIEETLRTYNAHAYIEVTKDGSLPNDIVHTIHRGETIFGEDIPTPSKSHEHSLFQTFHFTTHGYLSVWVFRQTLDTLPNTIYRLKGFVRFIEAPHLWYLVQKVGYTTTIEEWRESVPWEEISLVGIWKGVNTSEILLALQKTQHRINPLFSQP